MASGAEHDAVFQIGRSAKRAFRVVMVLNASRHEPSRTFLATTVARLESENLGAL